MKSHSQIALSVLSLFALTAGGCTFGAEAEGQWGDDSRSDEFGNRIAPAEFRTTLLLDEGQNSVPEIAGTVVFRVDLEPKTHASFDLRFPSSQSGIVLGVERWDGSRPIELGETDSGPGLRVLAALPANVPTTYWVTITSPDGVAGATLDLSTDIFHDRAVCEEDCRRLLQMPTPDDAAIDGYYSGASSVIRQQFGRRDLLMALRYAGRLVASDGNQPFQVEDLSNWNGSAPPGHGSHKNGEDIDLELYSADGINVWRDHDFFCTSRNKRCNAGSVRNFDARATALMLGGFFESERVTLAFLDQALITEVRKQVPELVDSGLLSSFAGDQLMGGLLMHWDNHENHAHLRFRETSNAIWGSDEEEHLAEVAYGSQVFAP